MSLVIKGSDELKRVLEALGDRARQAAAPALHQEHEAIMTEAKKRTPVDTGALRNSGHVSPPEIKGDTVVSEGGFGGVAAPYAVIVHERLDVHHLVGQAKFYESAITDAQSGMEGRLAERMRKAMSS